MARRDIRRPHGEEPRLLGRDKSSGKGGGLFAGLLIGLLIGLAVAGGMAWYFNSKKTDFQEKEQAPAEAEAPAPVEEKPAEPLHSSPPPKRPVAPPPPEKPAAPPEPTVSKPAVTPAKPAAPIEERKPPAAQSPARVPLTFYGILPGEKPAKPVEPPKPTELWWLQVAALKSPADADRLKARLAMLGLMVSSQPIESGGQTLSRVRVGPYKRDEDAFADLDTLSAHGYEPRLLKEPVKP